MKALLVEEVLKRDKFEFEIDYDIDSTKHSEERKTRVDNEDKKDITNEEITENIDKALDEISHDLMFDLVTMGDKILIINEKTKLNIVSQLRGREHDNTIIFKIITVMRKEGFWVNHDTRRIIKV